jgi:hypothetical protein
MSCDFSAKSLILRALPRQIVAACDSLLWLRRLAQSRHRINSGLGDHPKSTVGKVNAWCLLK